MEIRANPASLTRRGFLHATAVFVTSSLLVACAGAAGPSRAERHRKAQRCGRRTEFRDGGV